MEKRRTTRSPSIESSKSRAGKQAEDHEVARSNVSTKHAAPFQPRRRSCFPDDLFETRDLGNGLARLGVNAPSSPETGLVASWVGGWSQSTGGRGLETQHVAPERQQRQSARSRDLHEEVVSDVTGHVTESVRKS